MSEQFSIPTPGDFIAGKYRVVEELGRGAYGVVFRAQQKGLDRDVALKTLLPQAFLQPDIVQRFRREAKLISRLDHPNVIRLYDYGVDEGLLYMAVEFVDGRTLQDLIDEDAPLDPERVRALAIQMLDALEYAHGEGIVHRDLKPDNIVLLKGRGALREDGEQIKILDFGIAKLIQEEAEESALKTLTRSGTVLGTPYYMSPENIVGDPVDYRADLYALGVIFYEMLVGEHPFDAPSANAVMVRHLRDDPEKLPDEFEGTGFALAIEAALEKQPLDRVQSAREMRDILESAPVAPRSLSEAEIVVAEPRPEDEKRRGSTIAIVAFLGAILAVSVGWKLWYAWTKSDPTPVAAVEETSDGDPDGQGTAGSEYLKPAPGEHDDSVGFVIEADESRENVDDESVRAGDDGRSGESLRGHAEETDPEVGELEEPPEAEAARPTESEPKKTKPASKRKPEKSSRPGADREPAVETVELTISSTPVGANVTVDGRPIGNTPLKHVAESGEKPLRIRISHIGYKHETLEVVPSTDRAIEVDLDKERIKLID